MLRIAAALAFVFAATPALAQVCAPPKPMSFAVSKMVRLDRLGFTEGFEFRGPDIWESTGSLFGDSRIMRIAPDGHVTVVGDYGTKFFGEGLTIVNDQIYQLSWRDHLVFVYDLKGELLRTMRNAQEGWGLTHDGDRLVFSDGSDNLTFADPKTFAVTGRVSVREGRRPVSDINELEWVDGKIYANIFETRRIIRIDPGSGCVEAEAAMDGLWEHMTPADRSAIAEDGNFVLNGIAWDPARKMFALTGKQWPIMFEGRFTDR